MSVLRGSIASVALLAAACGRADSPGNSRAAGDSARGEVPWVAELGPILIVPGETEQVGVALRGVPSDSVRDVALVPVGGSSARRVAATIVADSSSCTAAGVRFTGVVPSGWTVGLSQPGAEIARLDSIEALAPADSSALAAAVARAASAVVPESRFAGLPFVVLKAYRLTRETGATIFANALRRLPQEATPLEEHVFVIAERAGAESSFVPGYSLISQGTEDTADQVALLAVLRAEARAFAVIERAGPESTRYEILERDANGSWRRRWSRAC